MAVDPKELQGVGEQPGTGGGGVPELAQAPAQGQPAVQPAVPVAPPTAPPTAARVNLDDLEEFRRWKSEADRRQAESQRQVWELQQQAAQARQQAQEAELRAQTADMTEEDKYKFLSEHYQRRLGELEQRQQEFMDRFRWRDEIAKQAGVNPADLPLGEVQPMMAKAFELQRQALAGRQQPVPMGRPPTLQQEPPRAPSAPTSSAPSSSYEEWASGKTWQERQKRIPKGKSFEDWMREQGE